MPSKDTVTFSDAKIIDILAEISANQVRIQESNERHLKLSEQLINGAKELNDHMHAQNLTLQTIQTNTERTITKVNENREIVLSGFGRFMDTYWKVILILCGGIVTLAGVIAKFGTP